MLLLLDGVDQHDVDAVVSDPFDQAFRIAESQKRFNLPDVFCAQSKIAAVVRFPGESDRLQPVDDLQAGREGRNVSLVAQAR